MPIYRASCHPDTLKRLFFSRAKKNSKFWKKIVAFKVDVKVVRNYVTENGGDIGGKNGGKGGGEIPVIKLTERQRVIIELISSDSTLSARALSEKMSEKSFVNERTIERDIAILKKLDYLRRIGGRKDGHWEVNIPLNSVIEKVESTGAKLIPS